MAKVAGKSASNKWAVCYSDDHSVIHFVFVAPGQVCDTGQPNFELYNKEQDAIDRCLELNPDWKHPAKQ